MEQKNELNEIARKMREARRILFITGAGVSADSGLPTYRGVGGLYNGDETEDGLPIEEALSGECFLHARTSPGNICRGSSTIAGAYIRMPRTAPSLNLSVSTGRKVVVLTQNIDGLHLQAGSTNVIEIHGTLGDAIAPSAETGRRRRVGRSVRGAAMRRMRRGGASQRRAFRRNVAGEGARAVA